MDPRAFFYFFIVEALVESAFIIAGRVALAAVKASGVRGRCDALFTIEKFCEDGFSSDYSDEERSLIPRNMPEDRRHGGLRWPSTQTI